MFVKGLKNYPKFTAIGRLAYMIILYSTSAMRPNDRIVNGTPGMLSVVTSKTCGIVSWTLWFAAHLYHCSLQ